MKLAAVLLVLLGVAVGVWFAGRGTWDGKSRFTVVSIGDAVKVESVDPAISGGVRFELPGNLEVETVGGKGKWRVEVLGKLAKKYGVRWAADSVADYLGIGYTAEKGGLWWWWKRRETEWREVDMVTEGLVREVTEVDGQKVLVTSENWEPSVRKWFVSGAIANENLSVEVENASGVDGAGINAARMIETAGIKVDKVESGEAENGKCTVVTSVEDKKKLGVVWLMRQLGCKWKVGEGVKVILGRDYGSWWKGD